MTFSHFSLGEIERNTSIPPARVTIVHLGVPDPFGEPSGPKEREALTVGGVNARTLVQGVSSPSCRPRASCRTCASPWRAAGSTTPSSGCATWPPPTSGSRAGSQEELEASYRRAAVYVQASLHEGFGLAVAEAMLAGCVPVVMNVTAMPEVVGDAGVLIESQRAEDVAAGVRRALELGPEEGPRARA